MRFNSQPIDRASVVNLRKDDTAVEEIKRSASARFLLIHKKRVLVHSEGKAAVFWFGHETLQSLVPEFEQSAIYIGPASGHTYEAFAVDVSSLLSETNVPSGSQWQNGRDLMLSSADDNDVTIAGLAICMCNWHETALFDGRTGKATKPVEGGMKRQVVGGSSKLYPRTDPVAIGLITSPDGERCLLGRGQKHPEGMYTCLAGFVDQCESVEAAFQREAMEEAGVTLAHVELATSQPWPIGRAGSCELMIGCHAVAASDEVKVNPSELQDARWFSRQEVRMMLDRTHPEGKLVPGQFAIAHHLIRRFADSKSLKVGQSARLRCLPGPAFAGMLGVVAGIMLMKLRSKL